MVLVKIFLMTAFPIFGMLIGGRSVGAVYGAILAAMIVWPWLAYQLWFQVLLVVIIVWTIGWVLSRVRGAKEPFTPFWVVRRLSGRHAMAYHHARPTDDGDGTPADMSR